MGGVLSRVAAVSVTQARLIAWALLGILPLGGTVMTALQTGQEIIFTPWALPKGLQWDNFVRAWREASIGRYLGNSLIVVGGSLTLTLTFSSMTAYVLARFQFPGNRLIYYMFM